MDKFVWQWLWNVNGLIVKVPQLNFLPTHSGLAAPFPCVSPEYALPGEWREHRSKVTKLHSWLLFTTYSIPSLTSFLPICRIYGRKSLLL